MDHRITQCPRCGTSFRVTDAHLAVAAGAVRCGSCLHIFNAREHWAEQTPSAPAAAEKPLSEKKIEEIDIDDDALFDDDTPLFGDDEPEPAKTKSGSIFNPIDDDFEVIDDSGEEKLSESFLDINSWEEDSGHNFSREVDSDNAAEDESNELAWTQKLLEDDDSKLATAIDGPERPALIDDYDDVLDSVPEIDDAERAHSAKRDGALRGDDAGDFSDEFLNLDAEYTPPPRQRHTPTTAFGDPGEIDVAATNETVSADGQPLIALRELEQEPIRLHQFVHESRWPKIVWRLALVATIALSVWQYVYFNFDELARGALRPWLARACEIAHCVLPPQFDIAQIRTGSLIVRSHPTQRGTLAVDAVITNQAEFPQPFPVLQLQFSDLNGAPVAGRRFEPGEYLSGELAGAKLMPVRQPVHIALELVDPGSRAVNYQLSVAAPTAAQ